MDRKKIIVDEIKYWKKSRLLPEQYCNFLLSLYTEGEETGNGQVEKQKMSSKSNFFPVLITLIGLTLFGLTFLVIYFTDFSPFLQTSFVFFLAVIIFGLAIQVKRFDKRFVHLFILLGALTIFFGTVHFTTFLFPNNSIALLGTVIFTCFIWLLVGKKYNLKYFLISGGLGLLIAIYFIFI